MRKSIRKEGSDSFLIVHSSSFQWPMTQGACESRAAFSRHLERPLIDLFSVNLSKLFCSPVRLLASTTCCGNKSLIWFKPAAGLSLLRKVWCRLSYQIVNLMMPSTGDEDYLPCFLHNFNRGLTLVVARVNTPVLKTRCGHVKGQVAMAVLQVVLLSRGVQQPFLSPAYIGWPAIGTEDISMEWSPVGQIRDLSRDNA